MDLHSFRSMSSTAAASTNTQLRQSLQTFRKGAVPTHCCPGARPSLQQGHSHTGAHRPHGGTDCHQCQQEERLHFQGPQYLSTLQM